MRWWLGVVIVVLTLVACGQDSTVSSSAQVPASASPSVACIDGDAWDAHINAIQTHVSRVSKAITSFDTATMVEHLRLASSEAKTLADLAAAADPEAANHLTRAADALDQAATAANENGLNLSNANSYLSVAVHEITLVGQGDVQSLFC